jgi:hypothetical protein
MKRILSMGLVAAALLAGCGGSTNTTSQPGNTGDTTASQNATAVSDAGATAADATAIATAEAGAQPTSAAGDTAAPTAAAGDTAAPTSAPAVTGDMAATQPATIPEMGLSFMVPEGWEAVGEENAWAPGGAQLPMIGVNSADMTPDWRPSSFLPEGAAVKSTQIVTLPSGQVSQYMVENSDGTAETHSIMRSGDKAYDFYARTASFQELQTLQPLMDQVVGSVQIGS